jgi:hypothetical protein
MIKNYIGLDHKGTGLPKLEVEVRQIYKATSPWSYSHHAHITHFKGKFYVMYSNGWIDEDDVGQRVMLSTSEDFEVWTEPEPLVDTLMGELFGLTLTAGGWHVHADTLVAYIGEYEYDLPPGSRKPDHIQETPHRNTNTWAITSKDGQSWSERVHIVDHMIPNYGPQPTKSGRLIMTGHRMYPYTDNPSGLAGWQVSGLYTLDMPMHYAEGSFIQTDDGALRMFLRTGRGYLWYCESTDDGVTWSVPEKTAFTDSTAKFHFGRLPDGRFYYAGNPSTVEEYRTLFVLSISEDGQDWTESYILRNEKTAPVFEGIYKDCGYQYPHSMVLDGHLYVVYSVNKEDVQVLRLHLDQL